MHETGNGKQTVAVECFLHRIFPPGFYKDETTRIVQDRLFKPRKDCPEVSLKTPIDWEASEHEKDRNWRMQLQGWTVFQPIMNFFDTYEDKTSVLDFFFDLAQDWWDSYGADPDNVVTSRMPKSYAWYDMSVGFRALIIAYFLDRISAYQLPVSKERRTLLEQLARKHIANLRSPETFSLNNHGVFQAQGLMALLKTLYPDGEAPGDDIAYALDLMERLVSSQYDAHGIHREHSPHYHFYVLNTFNAVIKSGWYAQSTEISTRITRAQEACKWLVDPKRRPICIGDSILTPQTGLQFPETGTEYILSDFDTSGYSAIRSGWGTPEDQASMLFLMGGYHSKTHKHRDCLSFDWFDRGERIICDGGKYGYKSDKYRNYVLSYRAHNCAEIEGFDILSLKPYGSAIQGSEKLDDGIYRIRANLDFPAIKHSRELYFKPGKWLLIRDLLTYARARSTTLWLHLETDYSLVSAAGQSFHARGAGGREIFVDCLAHKANLEFHIGNETEMKGFVSAKDYEISPALTAGIALHGSNHLLHTTLALDEDARADAIAYAVENLGGTPPASPPAGLDFKSDNLLPNIKHAKFLSLDHLEIHQGQQTYGVTVNKVPLNFFYHKKRADRKKLLVMLPGASARKKSHMDFQRHAWARDFKQHDVVAFTDPTLKPTNTIGLAWFQHTPERYGIEATATLIRKLIEKGGYAPQDVTLFGSSGGGFAVLQLADFFPEATVLAINPQIFLYNYTPSFYQAMLDTCYPGMTDAEVRKKFRDRITVRITPQDRKAPVVIFQNRHDEKHMNKHLRPFLKQQDSGWVTELQGTGGETLNKINTVIYDDPASGHAPPSKEVTLEMLAPYL